MYLNLSESYLKAFQNKSLRKFDFYIDLSKQLVLNIEDSQ